MKIILSLFLLFAYNLNAQEKKSFHAMEVIVESEEDIELGAWQAELMFDSSKVKITGIEGGDKPFENPADYDSKGMTKGKLILASFTLKKTGAGKKFKVGVIHFYGDIKDIEKCRLKLVVAADSKGKKVKAQIFLRSIKSK